MERGRKEEGAAGVRRRDRRAIFVRRRRRFQHGESDGNAAYSSGIASTYLTPEFTVK